jgi:hypothetical protein
VQKNPSELDKKMIEFTFEYELQELINWSSSDTMAFERAFFFVGLLSLQSNVPFRTSVRIVEFLNFVMDLKARIY